MPIRHNTEYERGKLVQTAQWLCHKKLQNQKYDDEAREFTRLLGNNTQLHDVFYTLDVDIGLGKGLSIGDRHRLLYGIAQAIYFAAEGTTLGEKP